MALTKVPSNLDATIATTQSASDNSTNVATTAYVTTAVSNLVDGAPAALNTLNEIAAALNDDAALNTTLTNSIATKLPLAGGTMTGALTVTGNIEALGTKNITAHFDSQNYMQIGANSSGGFLKGLNSNVTNFMIRTYGDSFILNNNFGIGTTSPDSNLHIKTSVDNSVAQGLVIERSANTDKGYINYNGGAFQIRSTVGDPIAFGETDAEHMRISPDGNVGIGTSSPDQLLSVKGRISSDLNDDYYGAWLDGNSAASQDNFLGLGPWHNNAGYIKFFQSSSPDRLSIYTTNTGDHVTLQEAGGNVGIGTTSPSYKFDVYGEDDITMRVHRPNSGLAATDTCGIGFSHRGDTTTSVTDTRAGIFSTYNGDLFLAVESGGNLNSNPMDHSALFIEGANANVGIGTTNPAATLHVDASGGANFQVSRTGVTDMFYVEADGTNAVIRNPGSNNLVFQMGGTSEKMRITSTGNVGIGTSSPGQNLTVSSSGVTYSRVATTASTQAAAHEVVNSTGGGISTISYSNSASGTLFGLNRGGKTFLDSSQDMAIGTSGNAFLSLITNSTERARINSNGTANFGNITAGDRAVGSTPNGALEGFKSGSGTALYLSSGGQTFLHFGSAETGGKDWTFRTAGTGNYGSAAGDLNFVNHTGGYVMTMDYSAGTINGDFNDTSDVALKENIVDINVGLDELKQLQPRNFGWKRDDKTDNTVGFVAQEVETVLSNLVSGEDYDEANPEHGMGKAINTSGLLAVAIKAIQELTDKLEAAEARITTLEG